MDPNYRVHSSIILHVQRDFFRNDIAQEKE